MRDEVLRKKTCGCGWSVFRLRMKGKVLACALGAFVLAVYGAGSYFFSSTIVSFRPRTLAESRARAPFQSPTDAGLPEPRPVRIPIPAGNVAGWLFLHSKPRNCGVILQHGRRSRKLGMLKYARIFRELGCHMLLTDARRHGESDGEYSTYGFYEKHDIAAARESFSRWTGLATGRIGYFGCSMGAAIVLQAAALEPPPAFVIADSPYDDLVGIIGHQARQLYGDWIDFFAPGAMAFAAFRADFVPEEASPKRAARHVSAPVLLIHARDDTVVPFEHSQRIFESIPHENKRIFLTDWGAKHCRSVDRNYDEYRKQISGFLRMAEGQNPPAPDM